MFGHRQNRSGLNFSATSLLKKRWNSYLESVIAG
jgi:hypothetical protein